jgi:hypothetical protein
MPAASRLRTSRAGDTPASRRSATADSGTSGGCPGDHGCAPGPVSGVEANAPPAPLSRTSSSAAPRTALHLDARRSGFVCLRAAETSGGRVGRSWRDRRYAARAYFAKEVAGEFR